MLNIDSIQLFYITVTELVGIRESRNRSLVSTEIAVSAMASQCSHRKGDM